MRYYFAGAYERRAELSAYADRMRAAVFGTVVTSRWLWMDQGVADSGFSAGSLTTEGAIAQAWQFAKRDIEDIENAQVIVSFTGRGTRGGRHVEFGAALGMAMFKAYFAPPSRMVIVGPREHVFHCHPAIEAFGDFDAFLKHEMNREDEK